MATKWQEKNVGVVLKFKPGSTKERPVTDERDGSVGGKHVEHYDGRVDAEIHLKPINLKTGMPSGGDA